MNLNRFYRNQVGNSGISFADFDQARLTVASEADILKWSHGEVLKTETINYRTQKPEKDGLFCERIFGPEKDINPHDSRFKGVRSREAAVDKQGVLVTKSISRRYRMGHIRLAAPAVHPWFLKSHPSPLVQVSGLKMRELERITYFRDYLILSINRPGLELLKNKYNQQLEALAAEMAKLKEAEPAPEPDDEAVNRLKNDQLDKSADIGLIEMLLESSVHSLLSESSYQQLSEPIRGQIKVGMGGEAIYEMLKSIDLGKLIEAINGQIGRTRSVQVKKDLRHRLRTLEGMKQSGMKIESMCFTVLPVIPAKIRPIVQLAGGRFAVSDLNDLYRRVINRNNRLKNLIEGQAPEIICLNEKRMLQEAVDALIDNNAQRASSPNVTTINNRKLKSITEFLKGKKGLMRKNLLGKRVDYSGRSVIVSGPRLDIDECGLPKTMALEIFKPFVVGDLIANDYATNVKPALRLIETGDDVVWDALDRVIAGKYVLLNRQPTLHRLSIQAFRPKLIEGLAIQLPPLVCKGYNADFDGDAMTVHLPLSEAAQAEARNLMTPIDNLLHPGNGRPILYLEQDIVMGLYYLTYSRQPATDERHFPDLAQARVALDYQEIELQTPIALIYRGRLRQTTLGRVFFNEIFPDDFPFQNQVLTKRILLQTMALVYDMYDSLQTVKIANALKDLAFKSVTDSGFSIGLADFVNIAGKERVVAAGAAQAEAINQSFEAGLINEAERYRLVIQNWGEVDDKILQLVKDQFYETDTSLIAFVESEARGKIDVNQVKRMSASVGVQSDALGRPIELPVLGNYHQGLGSIEYFISARGARKTVADIALTTADSGYLTRKLIYAVQDVFTGPISAMNQLPDPATDPGFYYSRQQADRINFGLDQRLVGRYLAEPVRIKSKQIGARGDLITAAMAAAIEASDQPGVRVLSVLSNRNRKFVPRECYGLDLSSRQLVNPNCPIGVIAAQSIGEPSTQLKLDAKHSGGVASLGREIASSGLDRVIELVEARLPKGQGALAGMAGQVSLEAMVDGSHQITIQPDPDSLISLKLPAWQVHKQALAVKVGDQVSRSQVILVADDYSVLTAPVNAKVVAIKEASAGADYLEVALAPTSLTVENHKLPAGLDLLVKDGQTVSRGQSLTTGPVALEQLLALRGVEATQDYILNELSHVFISQDNNYISDKHFEVIVSQMFSQGQIVDGGDSELSDDDYVSKVTIDRINRQLVEAGKQPALWRQLVLGVTKISGLSDSFLAAAAFQNTTQILVGSAVRGRVDNLTGLTENVCLGRKIPVGTGVVDRPADDQTPLAPVQAPGLPVESGQPSPAAVPLSPK